MSVAYHIGLDDTPASMMSASLRIELQAFELCPITPQNCALLFEMTKVVVMRIDKGMDLGLGFLKPKKEIIYTYINSQTNILHESDQSKVNNVTMEMEKVDGIDGFSADVIRDR